jgi:Fe-Mn family superoxide dismutase
MMPKDLKQHTPKACAIFPILFGILALITACELTDHGPTFSPKQLAFEENALEPTISARTMHLHHDKHYVGYIKKANRLVKDSRFKGWKMAEIIQRIPRDNEHADIFNNVAQAWNHEFFFEGIKPQGGGVPQGDILARIESEFGSFEVFKAEFLKAAGGRFGSGWVWLVYDNDRLKIVTTSNADTPLAYGMHPLFTIDLWEHAYYLDYENRRNDYVKAVMTDLIDWNFVGGRMRAVPAPKEHRLNKKT